MNRLRRMVLVNSANVRYREVELDGHIHFIGTQGTGKSTLLRAILFFYNADSRRLGISKEKKPFADYYFPFADSYIFYEVQCGERRFCVWLYRRQNRLCFRFMDGGFERELVIDGNTARAEDQLRASAESMGIKVERAIHSFKDYRDILYGENRAMRRYALMQGVSNYSTVPRTISNIFLNANLDGDYIKTTIINSLSDESTEINLETNRHHLDTARAHYADVTQYLQSEAQAERIIEVWQSVQDLEERQRSVAWKIGAAFNHARTLSHGLQEQIASTAEDEAAQQEKLCAVQQKFETEKRRLGDRLAEVKKDILRSNERKRHYTMLGIDDLLKEAEELPALDQELAHCIEQRRALTVKAGQQEAQFQNAFQALENKSQSCIHQLRAELSDAKDRLRNECDAARSRFDEQKAALDADFEEHCGGLCNDRAAVEQELRGHEMELRRLDHVPLFVEERERLEKSRLELGQALVRLEGEQKRNREAVESLQREAEQQQALERIEGESRVRPLAEQRETLRSTMSVQKEELANLEGSLLEFLDSEVDGWHDTIGKTVRRDVLLRSGLDPRKADGSTLFGVDLKLEHLEADELSKNGLEKALAETERQLETLSGKIRETLDANRAAEDKLQQKMNRKIREMREAGKKLAADLFAAERDLERNEMDFRKLAEKTLARRAELQAEVEKLRHEARSREQELDRLIADRTEASQAALKKLQADFSRRMKQFNQELQQHETSCFAQVAAQEKQLEEQRAQLSAERKAVLKKAGVDDTKVAALDGKIEKLEVRLETIRRNETVRIEYAKDRREWIDRLPEFQSARAQLEQKLEHQSDLFERRIRNEQKQLDELTAVLSGLREELRRAEAETAAFEAFERDELFLDFESYIRHHDSGEALDCRDRIAELKDLAYRYEKQFKLLAEQVTSFAGLFNDGNCLGFDVHLSGEASFRTFAETLAAFVRDQKITPLKTEVTRKYSMVLNTIVTETNRLLQRESEVNKVIQKINGDFRSSNFVGVVHSIEMRMLESSNRIFQVLREICDFQAENHMNFGEIDLFNRGGSGNDEKAVGLLDQLRDQMGQTKNTVLKLEDALDLEFRVCENENDTNWVNRLANVGSNGTDVLVKSMIYINLLNIFKTGVRKQSEPAQLHCLVDEVGILHDSNVRSLIQFAAERGICMINGSPNSHNEQDYKHIYMFRKSADSSETSITKLLSHAS